MQIGYTLVSAARRIWIPERCIVLRRWDWRAAGGLLYQLHQFRLNGQRERPACCIGHRPIFRTVHVLSGRLPSNSPALTAPSVFVIASAPSRKTNEQESAQQEPVGVAGVEGHENSERDGESSSAVFPNGESIFSPGGVAGEDGVPDPVDRDAHQLCVVLVKLCKSFVVQHQLIATNGAPVCGIERQDDGPPPQTRKREVLIRGDLAA